MNFRTSTDLELTDQAKHLWLHTDHREIVRWCNDSAHNAAYWHARNADTPHWWLQQQAALCAEHALVHRLALVISPDDVGSFD